tara:strand:+ start:95210 stop:95545 length:336 start_codon:yes stop_codon:yes gene_type:complete
MGYRESVSNELRNAYAMFPSDITVDVVIIVRTSDDLVKGLRNLDRFPHGSEIRRDAIRADKIESVEELVGTLRDRYRVQARIPENVPPELSVVYAELNQYVAKESSRVAVC